MAQIYLAKSNMANFDDVARLRKHLTSLGHTIVEFTGGTYTDDDLEKSDAMIMVLHDFDVKNPVVGRGLYDQSTFNLYKTGKPTFVYNPDQTESLSVHKVKTNEKLEDGDRNWKRYGVLIIEQTPALFTNYIMTEPKPDSGHIPGMETL